MKEQIQNQIDTIRDCLEHIAFIEVDENAGEEMDEQTDLILTALQGIELCIQQPE